MRIIIPFVLMCLAGTQLQSQWIPFVDFGVKAEYGINYMFNKNIQDDSDFNYQYSGGFGFGARFGFNFDESHAIAFDYINSTFNQKYEYNVSSPETGINVYNRELEWKNHDIVMVYRKSQAGQFLEVGGQLSLSNTLISTDDNPFYGLGGAVPNYNSDITDLINDSNFAAVLGFGQNIAGADQVLVQLGFRFKYYIQDIASDVGETQFFPNQSIDYKEYAKSTPFSAMLTLEINFVAGHLGKLSCSKRKKMIKLGKG